MPMRREAYPDDWDAISNRIRFERANGVCEQCGAPHGQPINRLCSNPYIWRIAPSDFSGDAEWFRPVIVRLTTHHIGVTKPDGAPGDPHDKMDVRDENLIALCQRCHLYADLPIHIANAAATRARKREAQRQEAGQLALELEG